MLHAWPGVGAPSPNHRSHWESVTLPPPNSIRPSKIRLDASTVCQLKCPACPTASGETGRSLGMGFLRYPDFKRLVDQNPWVSAIELSNWGEIFLNKELPRILEYAYRKGVALQVENGANLNHLDEAVAEAVVRFRMREITCSIDGASRETYSAYRIGGDFQRVIHNVKTINRLKARYRSPFPKLHWQFVAFGHNEHEIEAARAMARDLDMSFHVKLSWDDLYSELFSPVVDTDLVRRASGLDAASRSEYREKHGREYYLSGCCSQLWNAPQVNFDGRVLGCAVNYWSDFGNAFQEGLGAVLDNERISYARDMLLGRAKPREHIPCTRCQLYEKMKAGGHWLVEGEMGQDRSKSRRRVRIENFLVGRAWIVQLYRMFRRIARTIRPQPGTGDRGASAGPRSAVSRLARLARPSRPERLRGGVFSLTEPMREEWGDGWEAKHIFQGRSRDIQSFSVHMSQLEPGQSPHPPHRHLEEEILMVLGGEVELTLPDLPEGEETVRVRLRPDEFVYYPSFFGHTLRTVSQEASRYLMFKWHARDRWAEEEPHHGPYEACAFLREIPGEGGFRTKTVFEGSTGSLARLHCHVTALSPGAGYATHTDPYDVAIVLLRGEVETLGRRVGPGSLILYPAGEPHGMQNPGETVAEYVVFEFQAHSLSRGITSVPRRLLRKARSAWTEEK